MNHYEHISVAVRYLMDHRREELSPDELAHAAGVSPLYFRRMLAEWAGVTPEKFVEYLVPESLKREILRTHRLIEAAEATEVPSGLEDCFPTVRIKAVASGQDKPGNRGKEEDYVVDFYNLPFERKFAVKHKEEKHPEDCCNAFVESEWGNWDREGDCAANFYKEGKESTAEHGSADANVCGSSQDCCKASAGEHGLSDANVCGDSQDRHKASAGEHGLSDANVCGDSQDRYKASAAEHGFGDANVCGDSQDRHKASAVACDFAGTITNPVRKTAATLFPVEYGFAETPFGSCFIAATPLGVCRLCFADGARDEVLASFRAEWQAEHYVQNDEMAAAVVRQVFSGGIAPLRLHLRGTPFRMKVWKALLEIPSGSVLTYSDLSSIIRHEKAVRAVASAVAVNPVGLIIPCHRVIRKEGAVGEYRWKSERKACILGWERAWRDNAERIAGR
ncbi:methylated-DNA--[protein]-cysteine S-methyltransferase [Bacteroides pyogenes]|uniref:methylated-DNA--[protein]-cysteine S-methyltransferase n=1 Tax=Bacteroides pyogenes TaxID=310300 RepID=UPI000E166949|nr:methylated-DNA--[protein]-cysteine S-methyltransferase [Bacteroides pyogenes]MBB3895647.1 O-6-methylguanine DNA methyltransferase [Bacteroides pyogenes]SUV34425.1 DNA-O6-methylguanine--protein-cysteine S-methyltransferase /Transcriptional regulator Ada [Bacteroides pyogenes]